MGQGKKEARLNMETNIGNGVDLTGQIFGRLTVTRFSHRNGYRRFWICKCVCGKETVVRADALAEGHTQSCGCFNRQRSSETLKTHGMTKSSEYGVRKGILARCINPKSMFYKDYGGRGIKICQRWIDSFENFYADVGPRPSLKHTLERINNDGNYEPDNIKWATRSEQQKNKRKFCAIQNFSDEELQAEIFRRTPDYGMDGC